MNIAFHPDTLKQLQRPPRPVFEAVLLATTALSKQPRPAGAKNLVGGRNDWRVRIGQYRIVYEINDADNLVTIYTVAKRSDAYR